MTDETIEITTLTDATGDCERDDILALRQELEGQTPHAHAIVWTTDDRRLAVVDDDGQRVTVAAAIREVDAHLAG
jgi:hypothetical protein